MSNERSQTTRFFIAPDGKKTDTLPPQYLQKALFTPDALELTELHIIQQDLRDSYAAMKMFFDRYYDVEPGAEDHIIRMSLFRDAIVQYAACFSTKEKPGDFRLRPSDVYAGHIGWEAVSDWFLEIRDAYAAHSFGPMRQHYIFASLELNDARDQIRFAAIGEGLHRYNGPTLAARDTLLGFIKFAENYVTNRITPLMTKLHNECLEIDPRELAKYPDFQPVPFPEIKNARKSRARYQIEATRGQAPSNR